MRSRLLQYLVCPDCGGALALRGDAAGSAWIETGVLECAGCHAEYPVLAGVPRFPVAGDPAVAGTTVRTRRVYDFTWRIVSAREIAGQWEKDSYRYVELIPRALLGGAGKVGLEVGCGGGADLVRLAQGGAELIGIDLSAGAEAAARACRGLRNVHVVQADLHRLPFRRATFDFVYSFGVLHHVPDPEASAERLAGLLKVDGPLITYLYEDFSDRSSIARLLLGAIRGVRTVSSRMPTGVLYALCWVGAPFVWLGCSVPAALLRWVAPRWADRMPFRHTLRWSVLASDLFDRFAPPIERRYSSTAVHALYERAGLERVSLRRYRGWVSWGFKAAEAH